LKNVGQNPMSLTHPMYHRLTSPTHSNPTQSNLTPPLTTHRQREEAAYLLDCLIGAAPKLILPYISPIQKALVAKLKGGGLAAITVAGGGGGAGGGTMGMSASIGTGGGLLGQTAVGSAPGAGGAGMHLVSSLGSLTSAGSGLVAGVGGVGAVGGSVKDRMASEAGVIRSVLATLGQLATVAGTSFKPYVPEVSRLVVAGCGLNRASVSSI